MTSSRHWFDDDTGLCLVSGRVPVGVSRVCEAELLGLGGIDWKAWMGRASKNSWAMMKGVLAGSGYNGLDGRINCKKNKNLWSYPLGQI